MKLLLIIPLIVSFRLFSQGVVVHDPVMIRENDQYYLFCTGRGISVFTSSDLSSWKKEKPVFSEPPAWAVEAIPGFKGHIWAPDIVFKDGIYYLYYSVSVFGKNTSSVGVATNTTLDPANNQFKWVDHGEVIQSVPGRDLWNAIDPNLTFDQHGTPWLAFGSFWSGLKLVKLGKDLITIAQPEEWYSIAKRSRDFKLDDRDGGSAAVEAPFIFEKNGYYYLFASFDYCCQGKNSNYKIVAGRSKTITGPYIDKDGIAMNDGGGTVVLKGDGRWAGVGHNSAYTFDGKDYLVFHAYDNEDEGKPKIRIDEIKWSNGWPVIDSR